MGSVLLAALIVVVAVAAGAPRPARACGASGAPFWTLTGSVPEDGAVSVPRDLGFVLVAEAWLYEPGGPGFASAVDSVRLFEDATGAEVPIQGIAWMSDRSTEAWHPDAPLAPNTTYRVEAALVDQGPMPPEVTGSTTLTFAFTTGEALTPALETTGELTMELEVYDRPVNTGCGPCGDGCEPAGTVRDVRAAVTIPPLSGGFEGDGYRGWLAIREDAPATFDGPGEPTDGAGPVPTVYVSTVPGEPQIVYADLPEPDRMFRPCVSLGAWDPAGHLGSVAPVCFDAMRPSDLLASGMPSGGGASCAVTAGASPGGSWSAVLALVVLGLRRRSRRN